MLVYILCLAAAYNALATSAGARVSESPHPYENNMDTYAEMSFPGARAVEIVFSPESATEAGCDYVRFYCDASRQAFFGLEKYHGGRGGGDKTYPGLNGRDSLIIPASSFVVHFHSDGRWVWRCHLA
jgi:hypothetical protein